MSDRPAQKRRKEIAVLCSALEGEKEQIEKRLKELYEEDEKLWERERHYEDCGVSLKSW